MKRAIFTFSLSLLTLTLLAQGKSVVNLGAKINTKYEELNPLMTPDGTMLYFTRCNVPHEKYDGDNEQIFLSIKEGDAWGEAEPVAALNIAQYNAILGISEDGNTYLIKNTFTKRGDRYKSRGLSVITREGSNWSRPQALDVKINDRGASTTGYMTPDGNTIFISYSSEKQNKNNDIYVIEKTGNTWSLPMPIADINRAETSEDAPFLSLDGRTFYFASNRGKGGRYDIYICERQSESWDKWSTPRLMSAEVNGRGWESYYKVNEAARVQYFCANYMSRGLSDIFTIPQATDVIIFGKLLNAITGLPLEGNHFDPKTNFKILANELAVDSLVVNSNATYEAKVPIKEQVTVHTLAPHYRGIPEKLDSRKIIGRRQPLDLKLVPDPYVIVRGKMLIQNTGQVLPANSNPHFLINRVPVDSVKIDAYAGTYELKLPYGKPYTIQLEATKFTPLPRLLDLSAVKTFEERTLDMFVSQGYVATLMGRLMDPETKRPVEGGKIYVEGMPDASTEVESQTGNYELRVPSGKSYKIVYMAPQYIRETETMDARRGGELTIVRDVYLNRMKVGVTLKLKHVFFDFAKSTLKPESFPELEKLVAVYQDFPHVSAEIAGHTDNVGSAAHNLTLSHARCQSVVNYLVSRGISKDQLVAHGYGLTRPVAPNTTPSGRAQNRRVEFVVLGL